MANPIEQLLEHGQSVWLDYIRRGLITSGGLARMVKDGWIRGETSNPTIFQKAIAGSHDYDAALEAVSGRGLSPYEAFLEIASEDIRMAADVFRSVYDATEGADGFVSFEAQAGDTEAMYAEARRMFALVGRPNVMIKIPGVPAGVETAERLIADGINVNITLLFAVPMYERFAEAYLAGLERRLAAGQAIDRIASVASFFVSRVDTKVDALLPDGSPLRGKVAIANARRAYGRFLQIFAGPRWQRLAAAGARVQRPLWASTGTKNAAYSDVLYVEELVGPETVNTMPEATLLAFLDHGEARPALVAGLVESEAVLAQAAAAGIDLDKVTSELLDEGLAAFAKDFDRLLEEIAKGMAGREGASEAPTPTPPPNLGEGLEVGSSLAEHVERRFEAMKREDVLRRIWAGDHTVWKDDPTEITKPNRLGWLTVMDSMVDEVPRLEAFAAEVASEGFTTAVLLGMGGSSLAPEVLSKTFGRAAVVYPQNWGPGRASHSPQNWGPGRASHSPQNWGPGGPLDLHVLDTTVPADILRLEEAIDLEKTLFIVASKSGTTVETLSHLAHFWEKHPDGRRFIAITDAATPLAATARERSFRRLFLNPESMGGRYSALSYFGLVPAALIGADLHQLLDAAAEAQQACHHCVQPRENPGARLGAVLGEAALAGRNKMTLLLPPEMAGLGDWIEQLIAESTGKEGKGIIPVVAEPLGPPQTYGDDRLFVAVGDHDGLQALEAAGHPVLRLPYRGRDMLGTEFFLWEFATAVAGNILAINPFDQPNVELAKEATARILQTGTKTAPESSDIEETLGSVTAGDYIALQAYLPRDEATRSRLNALRLKLRDRFRVATTLGYGPRYLHSTGQVHKGGPNEGVFLQLVAGAGPDIPIPGRPFTFGQLNRAQADGDFESLRSLGRRVARCGTEKLEEVLR